ncbi:MAG: 50S ribosomal protein L25 [candidate division Zixibacteria bacterium]|jgi:large subunit ribosomal protein L25|nr:50S ribosomal protein L25 [candidate division Zixibacteria bacterium]
MKEIVIEAASRQSSGKGVARKLRAARKIPAVVYGQAESPQSLEIDYTHFHKIHHALHGENALINLKIDGKIADKKTLIRDIQYDPIRGDILHIDFQRISMDEKIRVSVNVRVHGVPKGVKSSGGIMQWSLRSLEVLCLPADIPESIDINVEELDIHDGIKVRDLNYPNLDFANDPEETIVNVIPPALVKEEAPAAATAEGEAAAPTEAKPEEAAEPEVISEKKAEERRAEKEKAKKEEKK